MRSVSASRWTLFSVSLLALASGCVPGGDIEQAESDEEEQHELDGGLLPDIIVRESDLHTNYIDTWSEPGHKLLRLSNGTANVGAGKLYLYGVFPANPDGTQTVMQRIFNAAGEYEDRVAGSFTYHPGHSHIHFDNWGAYRIRQVLPGDGVGPVLAEGGKTSFCIVDLDVYSTSTPGYNPAGEFHGCGADKQGLSVGWADVYGAGLTGQSIDVTNVPDGVYWLESEVDPGNKVLELDETNNITRIKVTLGAPPLGPDSFEPNNDATVVSQQPAGALNSSNLGPVNPSRTVNNLSIHDASDVDVFRFYINDTGTAADSVSIHHTAESGDLDLELYTAQGILVGTSDGAGVDDERISLEGRPKGYYTALVRGKAGATNAAYSLTVDPPQNGAPSITITNPPTGNTNVVHALETYSTTWTVTDPENDPTWVTIWLNKTPSLDGNQVFLETSKFTPGEQGFHVINSSYVTEGTYWVYAEVTDGGTTVGQWSPGTISFIANPVCAHPLCTQGAKLNAAVCDPCAAQICATDPFCCNTQWDALCVNEVASICQDTCPSVATPSASVVARGGKLVLTGAGLDGATSVTIGGVVQPLVVDSATQITIPAIADGTPTGAQSVLVTGPLGTAAPISVTVMDLVINEMDTDTPSTDTKEFVEISTGIPNASLDGYSLVFFNGANDKSYAAISLDGLVSNEQGLVVVGNAGVVPAPARTWADNLMQNGADAVAIVQGPVASYPNNTPIAAAGLIDLLVYDTTDPDDAGLLAFTADGVQVNEMSTTKSIKRCGPGRKLGAKYVAATSPSPGSPNGVTCN